MLWASCLSFEADLRTALTEIKRDLATQLGGPPDLLLLFHTPHYQDQAADLPARVADHLGPGLLLGCTATGVIAAGREVEGRAAIAAGGALLPDVTMTPFRLQTGDLPDLDAGPGHWHDALGVDAEAGTHFLLLVDPGGDAPFDLRPLLMGLDFAYPGSVTTGGLASVLQENRLYLDDTVHEGGCVGVAFQGAVEVDSVVAQGCRSIGPTFTVTESSGYYLTGLDERPAVEVLVELYHRLPPQDQELLQRELNLGVAATSLKADLGRGDFLIRSVLRLDHEKGIIAVGDMLRNGQTVQFHLRDPETATADLDHMLDGYLARHPRGAPAGAVLFTCTGRGRRFFGVDSHDTGRLIERLGDVPVVGFFAGGEIGPVVDATFLHGYTSSFGLFRPPEG